MPKKVDHAALQAAEHAEILALCEQENFDMAVCRAMPFKDLQEMWSDYVSDRAMEAGIEPGV